MPITLLFLEDNPADMELEVMELQRAGLEFEYHRVDTRDAFIETLQNCTVDLVIADYTLPQYSALEALNDIKTISPEIPLLVVTGTISEEVAVECMKQGAVDYLIKDRLARLPGAVENALEERRLRNEREEARLAQQESEARYRSLVEFSPDAILIHVKGIIKFANPYTAKLIGAGSVEELIGTQVMEFVHPDYRLAVAERIRKVQVDGLVIEPMEEKLIRKDGTVIDVEISGSPFLFQGEPASQLVVRDISNRKRRERELRAIASISEGLRMAEEVGELVPVVLDQVVGLMDAEFAILYLFDAEREVLHVQGGIGIKLEPGFTLDPNTTLVVK